MSDADNWDYFIADCLKAADKAERRSSALSTFGVISFLLGLASTGIFVVTSIKAKDSQDRIDAAVSMPIAFGILAGFVITAVVLFAAASVVEIAGKRLRLDVIAGTDRELAKV
jgi:Na+-driven multidrug efflux pump